MSLKAQCKTFNGASGWGFIAGPGGTDIFVHIKECKDGKQPRPGDMLTFAVEPSLTKAGQMVAKNVMGGSAEREEERRGGEKGGKGAGKGGGKKGGGKKGGGGNKAVGAHQGSVKSFVVAKGYGFIDYTGQDVFLHVRDCLGGTPVKGDIVHFDMEPSPSKPGQMIAKNVTGGSAPLAGKGAGKDDMNDMSPYAGMNPMGMMNPYGGMGMGMPGMGMGMPGMYPGMPGMPMSGMPGMPGGMPGMPGSMPGMSPFGFGMPSMSPYPGFGCGDAGGMGGGMGNGMSLQNTGGNSPGGGRGRFGKSSSGKAGGAQLGKGKRN